MYLTVYSKPDSFKYAIDILQNDKEIISKIGDYESYSYNEHDLPKAEDNPALVRVSLKGSDAEIYISCKVRKDTLGKWNVIDIHQDSLVKSP